jgi:hypothetical protein
MIGYKDHRIVAKYDEDGRKKKRRSSAAAAALFGPSGLPDD